MNSLLKDEIKMVHSVSFRVSKLVKFLNNSWINLELSFKLLEPEKWDKENNRFKNPPCAKF